MIMALVIADILGTTWVWIVWMVIGGIAGTMAQRVAQGERLGIVGNIVVGIIGGLMGGVMLVLFGVGARGIIWTFITALLGAIVLLWIVGAVTSGDVRSRY